MAEFIYGVTKVHGFVSTGYESLTSNFEFITITTAIDIRLYANHTFSTPPTPVEITAATTSQAALDKLIQIVSLRGQPVIMGAVTGAGPYVVKLTIEHPAAWQCTATSGSSPSSDYVTAGPPPSGTDPTHLGLAWADVRAGEDLQSRIAADGINFGFTKANTTVVFSNILA